MFKKIILIIILILTMSLGLNDFVGQEARLSYGDDSESSEQGEEEVSYTVEFKDYDGSILEEQTVNHGEDASEPSEPEREGYEFKKWDIEFTNVTEDLVVIAEYEILTYTVEFKDYDESIIKTQIVKHGEDATKLIELEKEGYTFLDLNNDFINVTQDFVFTAERYVPVHTVKFIDYDDYILDTQIVEPGEDATAFIRPLRDGYNFIGWDGELTNVTEDLRIRAKYAASDYTVEFIDYDDSVLDTQIVKHGEDATPPNETIRENYNFVGWDTKFTNVTEDLKVRAKYEDSAYKVEFIDYDDSVLDTQIVNQGEDATPPDETIREGHNFIRWDTKFTNVTENLKIRAEYESFVYVVEFIDYDDSVLDTQIINYGEDATAPDEPKREGYEFKKWDTKFTNVTEDLKVRAEYEAFVYKVEFIDYDDYVLDTQIVNHGEDAMPPNEHRKEGYTLIRWDTKFTNVTEDLKVRAEYEKSTYKVEFIDYDNSVLDTQIINHGEDATAPDVIIRENYNFVGWNAIFTNVTEDLKVRAEYQIKLAENNSLQSEIITNESTANESTTNESTANESTTNESTAKTNNKTVNEYEFLEVILTRNINVSLNGEIQTLTSVTGEEIHPIVNSGTSYLPVRAMAKLAGLSVDWNSESRTILLEKTNNSSLENTETGKDEVGKNNSNQDDSVRSESTVNRKIGLEKEPIQVVLTRNINVSLDGEIQTLTAVTGEEIHPIVSDGVSYLPVRAIAKLAGLDVGWNEENRTILLKTTAHSSL